MKTKKVSKFTLDKFKVAKFKNLKGIVGGISGDVMTTTGHSDGPSSNKCEEKSVNQP